MKIPGFRSKTPWKMALAGFVYALMAMIVVIAIIDPSKPVETSETNVNQVNPADMPIEEYAKYLVVGAVGETTNGDKDVFIKAIDTTTYLAIDLNASENLTTKLTKTSMIMDSKDIFKQAFSERSDIQALKLVWYLDLVDVKGNESVGSVMWIQINKENASTINWDNILTNNLPKIADGYWEHPLFSN